MLSTKIKFWILLAVALASLRFVVSYNCYWEKVYRNHEFSKIRKNLDQIRFGHIQPFKDFLKNHNERTFYINKNGQINTCTAIAHYLTDHVFPHLSVDEKKIITLEFKTTMMDLSNYLTHQTSDEEFRRCYDLEINIDPPSTSEDFYAYKKRRQTEVEDIKKTIDEAISVLCHK